MTDRSADPSIRLEREPDAIAVGDGSATLTVGELERRVGRAAAALDAVGVRPGGRLASRLVDGVTAVVVIQAARRLGAVHVPLSRRATRSELAGMLARARADVVVGDDDDTAIVAGASGVPAVDVPRLDEAAEGEGASAPAEPDPDTPARILFTSGTGGVPKAVVLTHANLRASVTAWAERLAPRSGDHWLACLPLWHVAGLAIVDRAEAWAAPLTIHPRFDAADVAAALEAGITHVSLVPEMLERVLDAGVRIGPRSALRAVLLGGGPIRPSLLARSVAAGLPVLTTYGMTETGSGIAVGDPRDGGDDALPRLRPLPGADVAVPSPDATGFGEIVVRGRMVSPGYVRDDGSLPPARSPSAAFATGDIGAIDDDGTLTIADRRDDLIISGGENVSPAEVEATLRTHPDVADAAVIGRDDARWGRVPIAFVVSRAGRRADPATLIAHARGRLAAFKVPVAVELVDELPRTPDGKLRRRELRAAHDAASVADVATRSVARAGADVSYTVRGDGPALVLLHATLSSARQLRALAAQLAPDHRVIAVDRRESGGSVVEDGSSPGPIDVAVHVADLEAVLDVEGVAVAELVGHSYGGCLALEFAARRPGRVGRVWAYEPPYAGVGPPAARAVLDRAGAATTAALRRDGPAAAAEAFLLAVSGDGALAAMGDRARARLGASGRGAVAEATLEGMRPDGLRSITAPVTIATGDASDPTYRAVADALVDRIPGARSVRLDGAEHMAPITRPADVAAAIRAAAR